MNDPIVSPVFQPIEAFESGGCTFTFILAEHDGLQPQTEQFAESLRAGGVDCQHATIQGVGYMFVTDASKKGIRGQDARDKAMQFVDERLAKALVAKSAER